MPASSSPLTVLLATTPSLLLATVLLAATAVLLYAAKRQTASRRALWACTAATGLMASAFLLEVLSAFLPANATGGLGWTRAALLLATTALLALVFPQVRRQISLPPRTQLEAKNQQLQAEIERIKHTNEVIALSEARYRLLMDTAAEGIWILDRVGRISLANPRLANMLGTTPEQMKGRALLELVPETERPDIINLLQRQKRGEAVRTLCHLLRPDGRLVAVQISSTPMSQGAATGSSLSVIDRKSVV